MVISCPSCSARYQLADSKIKEKGTKVRCPRCSHTFVVFPQSDDNDLSDRTELFVPREEILKAPKPEEPAAKKKEAVKPSPPKPAEPSKDEGVDMDFDREVFDQKTMVSKRSSAPENQSSIPPEKTPAPSDSSSLFEETAEKSKRQKPKDPASVDKKDFDREESESASEIRPFGDATLFEIQRGGRKKKTFLKRVPKSAIVAVLIVGAGYLAWVSLPKIYQGLQNLQESSSESSNETIPQIEIQRSSGWYRHDPSIYQDTLAQIAGLPRADQEKPENRALLSETLVLNGMLVGAADQVNRGLSYIPLLTLSYPQSEVSMYGTAAYAVGNEDRMTMAELIDRWPESRRSALEYRLLEVVYLTKSGKLNQALQKSKALFDEKPNFQRANNYAYLMSLKHKAQAAKVFDPNDLKKLSNLYERHHKSLERQIKELSGIYIEIDSLLGKEKPSRAKTEQKAQGQKKGQEVATEKKAAPPKPTKSKTSRTKSKTASASKKQPTKLPKPNKELIALNNSAKKDRKEAQSLFEKGNQLFDKGDSDGALKAFRSVLRLDSEFADVYKRMGMIYMSKKDTERALRSFKIYLQLKPETEDKKLVEGWIKSLQ